MSFMIIIIYCILCKRKEEIRLLFEEEKHVTHVSMGITGYGSPVQIYIQLMLITKWKGVTEFEWCFLDVNTVYLNLLFSHLLPPVTVSGTEHWLAEQASGSHLHEQGEFSLTRCLYHVHWVQGTVQTLLGPGHFYDCVRLRAAYGHFYLHLGQRLC